MDETQRPLRLCRMLKLYRAVREIGVRALAKEIGISAPTLSRIENGKPCDMRSLGKLYAWMIGEEK